MLKLHRTRQVAPIDFQIEKFESFNWYTSQNHIPKFCWSLAKEEIFMIASWETFGICKKRIVLINCKHENWTWLSNTASMKYNNCLFNYSRCKKNHGQSQKLYITNEKFQRKWISSWGKKTCLTKCSSVWKLFCNHLFVFQVYI